MLKKRTEFQNELVSFVETIIVKDGVSCDVYTFINNPKKDLAIITVKACSSTPLQKVLNGTKTIEGHIKGKGTLIVTDPQRKQTKYNYPNKDQGKFTEISVGETMQWLASTHEDLIFYEVCYPPYKEGRYQNL